VHADYKWITLGYLIMRLGLVSQWLRAGIEDPDCRSTAFRYAAGISLLQVGWVLRLFLVHGVSPWTFLVLVALELAVPIWAERVAKTSCTHITSRSGTGCSSSLCSARACWLRPRRSRTRWSRST